MWLAIARVARGTCIDESVGGEVAVECESEQARVAARDDVWQRRGREPARVRIAARVHVDRAVGLRDDHLAVRREGHRGRIGMPRCTG